MSNTKDSLRKDLEASQKAFQDMMNALSDQDLEGPSANANWPVKALLNHLAMAIELIPPEVEAARKGKSFQAMPAGFFDWMNKITSPMLAKKLTRQAILDKYEVGYQAALRSLDSIQENEWRKRLKFHKFEGDIEFLFRRVADHHREHLDSIRPVMDKKAR